jgi:hypothetical protein
MITNDVTCTCEIKSRIAVVEVAFNRKKTLFTNKLGLNLRKKLVESYIWGTKFYGAETYTLHKLDQKYLENFEMCCWRSMEDIVWTDLGKNEAIVLRVKKERNILHTLTKRKGNWIGQIGHRKSLLNHITEGTIEGGTEVTGNKKEDVGSY